MVRKNLLIKGKVQGVGFRFFVKFNSLPLNISGFAKNLDNGDVLIEAQGNLEAIELLKQKLYAGNGFCKVLSIVETDLEIISNEKKSFSMY